ncbi:phage integrase SAM-like domain-containing protein [Chryseobacterium geocarposphaerae]|uniref:Phage integrase family protein n=1 Tax=Chryseobacterium geocarposphaerae TaxID=1416776 RepID=A0A2M9CBG4_9FLAO|nr:phage integrase SAM-like domain-containing protein [Chryseobacterium geocarposphaerae]PJJ68150.1 phage integrase family protein [Chryseobacterium geocarposphaerae]
MASISFFNRGKVENKESTIWVRLRDKNIDVKTPIPYLKCKPKDWKNGKCIVTSRNSNIEKAEINIKLIKLETKIISEYSNYKPELDLKEWLDLIISPEKVVSENIKQQSDNILLFIDDYISLKKDVVSDSTIKKANVVKQLLKRYCDDLRARKKTFKHLKFSDLDNSFRVDFEKYCLRENYKISTTYRNLKFLKMICKVAESLDLVVHKHTFLWKFDIEKASKNIPKSIYLTFEELDKIEKAEMPNEHLDNARDWLLIACYTGQRVSDYLRFNSSMIIQDDENQSYIEFNQIKTGTKMQIPLLHKVQNILLKRGGEFPRKISDVNLNLYIKDVCKFADIDEVLYNGKTMTIEREDLSKITRKVFGDYPKYELVTSHIGRKSFATNFYEKIPITYLLNFTGHKTERQLLAYISKTDVEKAKSTAKIFKSLGF